MKLVTKNHPDWDIALRVVSPLLVNSRVLLGKTDDHRAVWSGFTKDMESALCVSGNPPEGLEWSDCGILDL